MSSNWETNKRFFFHIFCRVNTSGNELFNISLMLEKIKNILLALQIWDSRISTPIEIKKSTYFLTVSATCVAPACQIKIPSDMHFDVQRLLIVLARGILSLCRI